MENDAVVEAHTEGVTVRFDHFAHVLTGRFGCVPIGHRTCATMEEIIGGSAVEGLGRIGYKSSFVHSPIGYWIFDIGYLI